MRAADERKAARKLFLQQVLSEGLVPTPDDIAQEIANLFITGALEILKHHRGYDLADKIRSLRTAKDLFEHSHEELICALSEFHNFTRTSSFYERAHRPEHRKLETKIRKEIYCFSSLAHSLPDQFRKLRSDWEPNNFAERMKAAFREDGLHDFICGLRNALHHRSMVEADWEIRNSGSAATSHYVFAKDELVAVGRDAWNASGRKYLDNAPPEIDIGILVRDYFDRVREFYDWLLSESDNQAPAIVQDYRRLVRLHHQNSARQTYRFLIDQFLQRRVNPYDYLPKYLSVSELLQVDQLASNSREQVDLIIHFIDEYDACDDDLRSKIYSLFEVRE